MSRSFCPECFRKQREIDRLEEEVQRLRGKLRHQERRGKEGFFGASTPSSKVPLKENAGPEARRRRGGGKPGHAGHGRRGASEADADGVIEVAGESFCPDCGVPLVPAGARVRTVIDCPPPRPRTTLYRLARARCPRCRKTFQARAPGVLPKSLYGNQLLARIAALHYLHGIPLGRIEADLGVSLAALVQIVHRLARLFSAVPDRLLQDYRAGPVRHADETSWRTDGRSGYAWLFATPALSLFRFRKTRSGSVPREVLGETPLPGVLVVDRYAGYNRAPCVLQYCYAHLLRDVQGLEKDFPDDAEVRAFVATLAPLLAQAMALRNQTISDADFSARANQVKDRIVAAIQAPARHLGVRAVQDLFRANAHRLYHWAADRRVPADNNLAERDLRPTVIARKVSFGSQSDAGAASRETLMTVLHTLKKRGPDPEARFKAALDTLAHDPTADPYDLLFSTGHSRD
jgi:transposase